MLLICFGCFMTMQIFSQPLFTYGNEQVSKDEFIKAFNKNITKFDNKEKSLKDYLELYSTFKLKVKAAQELNLDTLGQLKYDMMNFRKRLEDDYMVDAKEALSKVNLKRNPAVKDELLFRFADSVTLIEESRKYPIAREVIFSISGYPVKVGEWLSFVKEYKQNWNVYKGESNSELLGKFIDLSATDYYRKHLEDYNPDFKYQLQAFKEGNMMFEITGKKVWNKSTSDLAALQDYYEAHKDHFLWIKSADVILINAKSYAYADYASENMKNGKDWKKIAANSEGMIQGDSGRYEIAQLPVNADSLLIEGAITDILKSKTDNGASFVKVLKVYPAGIQRSFAEAKNMVINEYQQQLEEKWMAELKTKYPVKVNQVVFQSLLK